MITHIEKFDPLSYDNLKMAERARDKLPGELLNQEPTFATAQSGSLLVTMGYKEMVPVAR